MTYDEIKYAWNAQADDDNRWHSLSVPEKIEWAAIHAAAKERTARQAAQAEVVALKGIRAVFKINSLKNIPTNNTSFLFERSLGPRPLQPFYLRRAKLILAHSVSTPAQHVSPRCALQWLQLRTRLGQGLGDWCRGFGR